MRQKSAQHHFDTVNLKTLFEKQKISSMSNIEVSRPLPPTHTLVLHSQHHRTHASYLWCTLRKSPRLPSEVQEVILNQIKLLPKKRKENPQPLNHTVHVCIHTLSGIQNRRQLSQACVRQKDVDFSCSVLTSYYSILTHAVSCFPDAGWQPTGYGHLQHSPSKLIRCSLALRRQTWKSFFYWI